MKQETNNEMDLLLRRLSRRQEVPTSDGDSRSDADHLDADELSSYAENALPAAARARYTEHLAECSRCRELVVQLSASVPVVAVRETVTAAVPAGLRKFLASFFSPMVLRYAVPALALMVVAAIGFVVLRKDQNGGSVAQLNDSAPTAAKSVQAEQQFQTDKSGFQSPEPADSQSQTAKRADVNTSRDAQTAATPDAAGAVAAGRVDPNAAPPVQKTQGTVVNEPPPAAPKPSTVDEMRVEAEGKKPEESVRVTPGAELARQRADNAVEEQKKAEDLRAARSAKSKASTASPQAAGTGNSSFSIAQERDKDVKDLEDGVIRSVAGRRFRKRSGVWVDTAYNSGSTIVNVTRGSEQYRALIADEPEIKKIADELEGSILLVWKGSTYRIR